MTPLSFIDNTLSYFDSVGGSEGYHSLDVGVDIRCYQENKLASVWSHGNITWYRPGKDFLTGGACPACSGITSVATTGATQPTGGSWYNGMQLRLEKRINLGLDFCTSCIWSKNLGDIGSGTNGLSSPPRAAVDFRSASCGTKNNTIKVPGQRRAAKSCVGLQLSTSPRTRSSLRDCPESSRRSGPRRLAGQQDHYGKLRIALDADGGGYSVNSYCPNCTIRHNMKPGGSITPGSADINHWFDKTQFTTATPGYFGKVGKNALSGPRLPRRVDFSLVKEFPLREKRKLNFRAEISNIPKPSELSYSVGCGV